MKRLFDAILVPIAVLIGSFIFSFFSLFSLLDIFYHLGVISILFLFVSTVLCSIIFSVISFTLFLIFRHNKKFIQWYQAHKYSIVIWLFLVFFILLSLSSQVSYSLEQMRELLSLEWSIFGLSITLLLVWQVLINNHLRKALLSPKRELNNFERCSYIKYKTLFHDYTNYKYSPLILLSVNILLLIFSSLLLYPRSNELTLLAHNVTMICLSISLFSFFLLSVDLIRFVHYERKEILSQVEVSKEELDFRDRIQEREKKVTSIISEIDELDALTQEQKDSIKQNLMESIFNSENEKNINEGDLDS